MQHKHEAQKNAHTRIPRPNNQIKIHKLKNMIIKQW